MGTGALLFFSFGAGGWGAVVLGAGAGALGLASSFTVGTGFAPGELAVGAAANDETDCDVKSRTARAQEETKVIASC